MKNTVKYQAHNEIISIMVYVTCSDFSRHCVFKRPVPKIGPLDAETCCIPVF